MANTSTSKLRVHARSRRSDENTAPVSSSKNHSRSTYARASEIRSKIRASKKSKQVNSTDRQPLLDKATTSNTPLFANALKVEAIPDQPSTPHRTSTDSVSRFESYVDGLHEGDRIKARTTRMQSDIRNLELLVDDFKSKVDVLAGQFEGLQHELDSYSLSFDALEKDHEHAIAALEEERETVIQVRGDLRNEEVRCRILENAMSPEDRDAALCGYSQARPW
ncbi:hypothetical protein NMY22_g8608 [Coprinellus aureogranulatus]|nr:hypothetical protein NMY22_g8608 [Coprinellus aureogranulatus]